jgi:hypothetical protein
MNSHQQSLMLHKVDHALTSESIMTLARKSGFLKRTRKITAQAMIHACCLLTAYPVCSLTTWAILLGGLLQTTLSKQAVAKRLNAACVRFVRQSLFAALKTTSQLQPHIDSGVFQAFRRVLLQDSTSLRLPARLATIFPGSGNQHQAKTATLKIQTIYDALSENFVHFLLTPFTRNDQAASRDILALVQAGDLLLRDLGYFVLEVFATLNARGVYFLSRYHHGTRLFRPDGRPIDLLKTLRQHGTLDLDVLLGCRARVPVRLVAIPVPLDVAKARRRKQKHNRNRSVNPSAEHLALLGWEIFITNVPPDIWTTKTVSAVYGVRWRIEIIFKAWKQHFHLPRFTNASQPQIEVLIYAKLLFITLFQVYVFRAWSLAITQQTGLTLSLLKIAQFLTHHLWLVVLMLTRPDGVQQLEAHILKHCTYDRRRRLNYDEMLAVLT